MKKIFNAVGFSLLGISLFASILINRPIQTDASANEEVSIVNCETGTKKTIGLDLANPSSNDPLHYVRRGKELNVSLGKGGELVFSDYGAKLINSKDPHLARGTQIGINVSFTLAEGVSIDNFSVLLKDFSYDNIVDTKVINYDLPQTGLIESTIVMDIVDFDSQYFNFANAISIANMKLGFATIADDSVSFNAISITYYELEVESIVINKLTLRENTMHHTSITNTIYEEMDIEVYYAGNYIEHFTQDSEGNKVVSSNKYGFGSELEMNNIAFDGYFSLYDNNDSYFDILNPSIKLSVFDVSIVYYFDSNYVMHVGDDGLTEILYGQHFYLKTHDEIHGERYISSKKIANNDLTHIVQTEDLSIEDAFIFEFDSKYGYVISSLHGYLHASLTTGELLFLPTVTENDDTVIPECTIIILGTDFQTISLGILNYYMSSDVNNEDRFVLTSEGIGYALQPFEIINTADTVANQINWGEEVNQCTYKFDWVKKYVLTLSIEELNIFKTSTDADIVSARTRYEAWAVHLNQESYTAGTSIYSLTINENTGTIIGIITVVTIVSVSIIVYMTYSKRKVR